MAVSAFGLALVLLITVSTVPGVNVPWVFSFNLIVAPVIMTPLATTRSVRVWLVRALKE